MKKQFSILAAFLLSACIAATTPSQRYFELKQRYSNLLDVMIKYKKSCYASRPNTDICYKVVFDFNKKRRLAENAFTNADAVFKDGKVDYYDIAIVSVSTTLDGIDQYLKENVK